MSFSAGAAAVSLAAPVGIPMGGYGGRKGVAQGTHDDLQARALVLAANGAKVALVVADLVALDPTTVTRFREMAARACEIPAEQVLLTVTHTHSGPAYGSFLTRYLTGDGAARAPRFPEWEEALPHRLVEALLAAERNLQPAVMAVGRGEVRVSVQRRLVDGLGEVRLHPNPDGPLDPELVALRFESPQGESIATLVNYGCHPVVLCEDNLEHSADFPHYLRERMAELGGGLTLFVNGACGEINPARRGDFEAAAWVGTEIAEAAHRALQQAARTEPEGVGGASLTLSLPLKPQPGEEQAARYLAHARAAQAAHANPDNYEGQRLAAEVKRAEEQLSRVQGFYARLNAWGATDGQMEAQVQALRIGEVDLVGLPGENFMELGRTVRAGSDGRTCLVVGYCNRTVGYVPTREAYSQGGYEVFSSFLAPGAGEQMAAESIRLVRGLRS